MLQIKQSEVDAGMKEFWSYAETLTKIILKSQQFIKEQKVVLLVMLELSSLLCWFGKCLMKYLFGR